jgi:serine/threonine protein kinase
VYKAKRKIPSDERLYAIKILKKELVASIKQDLKHPYILQLQNSFQDDKRAYFVYEYLPGNQIAQCAKDQRPIPEERARFYAAEIVLALEYLHENKVVYKALCPPQMLVDNRGHVKLLQRLDLVEDKGLQLEDPTTCEYIGKFYIQLFLSFKSSRNSRRSGRWTCNGLVGFWNSSLPNANWQGKLHRGHY